MLVQRFMGKAGNRGVLMVVYMILLFIALVPGIAVSLALFFLSSMQGAYNVFLRQGYVSQRQSVIL